MKKMLKTNSLNSKGVHTMKKTLLVLALAAVLVFTLTTAASAKYAGYNASASSPAYASWGMANTIYKSIPSNPATDQLTPHGGYTATSVKCVVCHSIHRATSFTTVGHWPEPSVVTKTTVAGLGDDRSLLDGANGSCAACHAAWGSSPTAAIIEIGQDGVNTGPHIGGAYSCTNKQCHGSVHGSGTPSKYATAAKYNLTAGSDGALDTAIDAAITAGNVNASITTASTDKAMKAYVTGYVCSRTGCHVNSSFSVAVKGFANNVTAAGPNTATALTGHPSAGALAWQPTCDSCHDLLGVASNSTAWPHANRGIEVYKGRIDHSGNTVTNGTIATDNTNATRYGLWMTSAEYGDDANAQPIVDVQNGYSLQDGSCIKCHEPAGLK